MVREAYAAMPVRGFAPVYLRYCRIFFALPRLLAIINLS
jgi:hypothetical protein